MAFISEMTLHLDAGTFVLSNECGDIHFKPIDLSYTQKELEEIKKIMENKRIIEILNKDVEKWRQK